MSLTTIEDINTEILLHINNPILIQITEVLPLSSYFWTIRFKNAYGGLLNEYGDVNYRELYTQWVTMPIEKIVKILITKGYLSLLKVFIQNGYDIHYNNDEAIRIASADGQLEIIKYLIDIGVNVFSVQNIPFYNAVINGKIEVIKYLFTLNANIIHVDNGSAVQWASEGGHLEVVQFLVENNVNIHINNSALYISLLNDHFDIAKYLISNGLDIHNDNDRVVRVVANKGNVKAMMFLVENGIDITAHNNQAINFASQASRHDLVRYLLSIGADVNYIDIDREMVKILTNEYNKQNC